MRKIKILVLIAITLLSFNGFSTNYYYLRSNTGQPWGVNTNETAMNTVYGAAWTQGFYETVNVATMLVPATCFIFMEGGDGNATAFNTFLTANMVAIQNWVNAGGHLILNAAPNVGGNINYGFGGTLLNYNGGSSLSTPGNAAAGQAGHPIFNGPFLPCGTAYTGNWFAHAYITGGASIPIITGTPGNSLTELTWGAGKVMFGGMTTDNWHSPLPNAANLTANIITYLNNCCPTPTIIPVATPTSICVGASSTLTATGAGVGGTYTWTPGNIVGGTITVSPGVTTTYTVLGKTALGCTGTQTVLLTVNPLPTVTAVSNPVAICIGSSATLTAAGAVTYTWNPGNIIANPITVSPAVTTIYTVQGTNANGCKNTGTVNLIVNPLPVVNPGSNSPICAGGTLSLTVGAFTTYTWTGLAFASNLQNPTITNVTAANSGVYTVTVTNASGCKNSNTVNVVVNPVPVIAPANTGPYCAGATINLSVAAATSYTWTGPAAFGSNLQNPTVANAQVTNAGTYSVTVTGVGGCQSSGTTNVVVNALPVPIANSNSPVCAGQPINFTGTGGTTYTWTGPGAYNSNAQNPTIAVANATNAGVYTLSVTNVSGCKNFTTTNVVVNPVPVIAVNNPVACLNQAINLTSNGGATYSWSGPLGYTSNAQNPTILNAQLNMSGAYTVTVTSASGCTATAVSNVTVITLPVAVINSNSPVCAGGTLNLLGSGGATYSWNGPNGFASAAQNPSIPNVTLLAGGIYSLVVSAGTCSASTTAAITINALPTPTATSNSPVCAGQPINFTGAAATTYTWTGPAYNANTQNPTIAAATAANAGTYTFAVTDANGCSNSITTNVVVNPLPVIAVTNPTVCLNQTINLTANGGATYSWSGPGGFVSALQNPSLPLATLSMSGVYNVTVTSALGCVSTAAATATVYPLPNPNINANTPLCVGTTLNLTGSGGATYAWSGPNGFINFTQNPNITNVSMLANGVYSLLVSSGSCSAITTATITVNPLPTINFANTNVTCFGLSNGVSNTAIGVGTGPFTYTWNSIPVQNGANATNLVAGNYICTVSDVNGCVNSANTQITQPTVLMLAINSATTSACAGTPINLNGIAAGGTAPYTYTWSGGANVATYAANEVVSGNYTYTLSITDANGCAVNQTSNLTFNPQPTVTATSATVCAGQQAMISANGAGTYLWSPGNVTGATYTLVPTGLTNITVVGTLNGCTNFANTSINVNQLPSASMNGMVTKGCEPFCTNLSAVSATNIANYSWNVNGEVINTGNAMTNYCFGASGDYTVGLTVVDNIGCSSTSGPMIMNVYPKPVADFNHAPLKPIINVDPEVTFTDASYNATITNWNWYFANTAQYQSVLQNPHFTYDEPGTYAVALVVKSDKGCIDTIVQSLIVGEDFGIYVPNAFTPNADGLNDIFQPKGFGVVKYEFRIFNRWGDELFYTQEFEKGWDGTVKGLYCKEDSYTWKINATSVFGKHHELTGNVTLIR